MKKIKIAVDKDIIWRLKDKMPCRWLCGSCSQRRRCEAHLIETHYKGVLNENKN